MMKKPLTSFETVWSKQGIRGLRVGPARWNGVFLPARGQKLPPRPSPPPIPADQCSFLFFFAPIIAELGKYHVESVPYPLWGNYRSDVDFMALLQVLPSRDWVPPGTFFPEFAKYVGEGNWMDIYFVEQPPCSVDEYRRRNADFDVWIRNVDGAYWALFAKHQPLLDAVRKHMEGRERFFCEPELVARDSG